MINAFTVDVEDYFQVQAFADVIDRDTWGSYGLRVERNTQVLLDLLESYGVKGTFFVLGWVGRRCPHLVREIGARGHEIASHGMSHRLVYTQTPEVFREETRASKAILEDLCQAKVLGYRAATYSITRLSLWALDILVEEGFSYDSSIFPMRHDRYGVPDAKADPGVITTPKGHPIVEFPISVYRNRWLKLPVAGGGYFRLLPYELTRWGLSKINRTGQPFVFYLHPWEIDPGQPRIGNASALSRFRHYLNLGKCEARLNRLLKEFPFGTMAESLRAKGFRVD